MIPIQFIGGYGGVSDVIEYATGPLSHVDIIDSRGRCIGARSDTVGGMPPGVWPRQQGYFGAVRRRMVIGVQLDNAVLERVFWECLKPQVSKPYDLSAIWQGFVLKRARDWREESAWFCSELVYWLLETVRGLPRLMLPLNWVPPTTLATACLAAGYPDITADYPLIGRALAA